MLAAALATTERLLPGEHRLQLSNPVGARAGRSVIEVLVPDQPFLVDSIRMCLRRLGLRVLVLLHPLLPIERELDGAIARFGRDSVEHAREAYVYVELPRVDSAARRAEIERELGSVLEDVREVVADHSRMVGRLRQHISEIEAAGAVLEGGAERVRKLVGFLEWLGADNFIFLGYRHYRVDCCGEDYRVELSPESALGMLREAAHSRFRRGSSASSLPPLIRARLDDQREIYFDKSRTESRIHRQGRLDSIAVRTRDATGRVTGYGRFVGLLTHQAIRRGRFRRDGAEF